MRPFRSVRPFALALALALGCLLVPAGLWAAGGAAAAPAQAPDYAALIGDFPRPGSEAAVADQAILMWEQDVRTPEDVARARSEVEVHLGLFAPVTGKALDSDAFPLTRALSADLARAVRAVVGPLKQHFARPRPYETLPKLKPALPHEASFSYPSGHSSWGMSQAELLAALEPGRREAILDRGRQIGYDRALGGVHYPSDVEAGQQVGAAVARAWLADPGHRQRVEAARAAEWK